MTLVSQNVYIDKLDDTVGKYNNTYHRTIKMKPVDVKGFIRTLKTKIYKNMTLVSKNVYIDKLDDIVGEYNNTYHRTIKMKPVDVKDNAYIDFKKYMHYFLN